jgi:hypothetical protein
MIPIIIIFIVLFFVFSKKKKPINKVTTYPKTNTKVKSGIVSQKVVPQSNFKKENTSIPIKNNTNTIIIDGSSIGVSSTTNKISSSDNLEINNRATETKNKSINELVSSVQKNASNRIEKDNSIIDITGIEGTKIINNDSILERYYKGVPYWTERYVYDYSQIKNASPSQKSFYENFKTNFFNGHYFDLEGNVNYAFVLLFEFLHEYDVQHKDIEKLKNQLKPLGELYPKTKSYIY